MVAGHTTDRSSSRYRLRTAGLDVDGLQLSKPDASLFHLFIMDVESRWKQLSNRWSVFSEVEGGFECGSSYGYAS